MRQSHRDSGVAQSRPTPTHFARAFGASPCVGDSSPSARLVPASPAQGLSSSRRTSLQSTVSGSVVESGFRRRS